MRGCGFEFYETDEQQVPKGHCWVVGDNMPYSRDSRHFGPLPMALIKGKVIAKVFPWSERGWIANGLNPVEAH
jgi:inner membrane protease subunit 1